MHYATRKCGGTFAQSYYKLHIGMALCILVMEYIDIFNRTCIWNTYCIVWSYELNIEYSKVKPARNLFNPLCALESADWLRCVVYSSVTTSDSIYKRTYIHVFWHTFIADIHSCVLISLESTKFIYFYLFFFLSQISINISIRKRGIVWNFGHSYTLQIL